MGGAGGQGSPPLSQSVRATSPCCFPKSWNACPQKTGQTYFADPEALQRFLDQFDRSKGCVSTEYGMTYWIRDGNDVSAEYYDLNHALVDAIADMLPALREQARHGAVGAAQEEVRLAEQKLARLQAVSGGAVE